MNNRDEDYTSKDNPQTLITNHILKLYPHQSKYYLYMIKYKTLPS